MWAGAEKTIWSLIQVVGMSIKVVAPLGSRGYGRYDLPLPLVPQELIHAMLQGKGVLDFVKHIIPDSRLRAQDMMLSCPGSARQEVHTDSSWTGRAQLNPKPHYLTVLVPLTAPSKESGCTRVWPGSHHQEEFQEEDYVDTHPPMLKAGSALVFDGLLAHCGMENTSKENRYFYYAAYASGKDPNTEVLGF